jgi:hypothetical protein
VMKAYHDHMRSKGLTPYNPLWQWERGNPPLFATTMLRWWDGTTFALPADMEAELRKWAGHPFMLQNVSATPKKATVAFYQAAEKYLTDRGLEPYVHFDEPKPKAGIPATGQTAEIQAILTLAKTLADNTGIKCGPTCIDEWIPTWAELDAKFTVYFVGDNLGRRMDGTAWHPEHRPLLKGADLWVYYTSTWEMRDDSISRIPDMIANARTYGAVGVLMWTVFNDVNMGIRNTCQLYDLPPAGTDFDPKVYPKLKLDAFAQALKDEPAEPVPATWQEGYTMLDARLKAGGL